MFPFSSLFTQVPLIILAAAYMLYFGAYAVGKSKEIIAEDNPESIEQSVIINKVSKAETFYFSTTYEKAQYAAEPAKKAVTFFRFDITHQYFDPDREICSCFKSYSLFSRPPPNVG